jgi:hypothetical protein
MKWVTRPGCHVDRAASAWLIRRFIDPSAEFDFVDDPDDVPADATAFDMRGVKLSHHAGGCTFETICTSYDLTDAALLEIGRIIHEADIGDERYDAPEASGLDVLVRGLSMTQTDHRLLEITDPLFDGLYAFKQRAGSPSSGRS